MIYCIVHILLTDLSYIAVVCNISFAGLNRSSFDNKTVSFEEHVKHEHNMWHYLYFIVLVKVKDPTEFTGPESYVYAMVKVIVHRASKNWNMLKLLSSVYFLQDRNLDWFPRLRAKSLAADEGEGEQVELRSLQSQLESTQQLVKCLSQQLTELRDQVIYVWQLFPIVGYYFRSLLVSWNIFVCF